MAVRKHVEDMYPLSPMQRGMMFHSLQDPDSGVYLEQIRLSLDGLDVPALRRAWERVFERHAALRTSVVGTGREEPAAVVSRRVELPWSEVDLRGRSSEAQRGALEEFLAADAARGFRLGEPPLVRLALLRTGERSYELVWTIHHIVLDGWSGALVLRDLFRCYRAFRGGDQPDLPRARPFRDYVAWVKQQDLSRAEAYWRERLAGFAAPTTLSIDRGAAAGGRGVERYATEEVALSERHSRELAVAAARLQVTVNTLAQGAWALALGRYGGEEDVVFGAVVSGRPEALEGVDEMVGMFVNTLPQRVRIPGEASAREWLQGLQADQSELRDFSYSPLWQVQQWSQLAPGTPLFEHLFVFENVPSDPSTLAGDDELSVRGTPALDRTGYPLMLLVIPGERIVLRATYDAERFEGAAIRRLIGHYQRALAGLAEAGERPLSEVSLLDERERRELVHDWNRTERDFPPGLCMHHLFERQMDRAPDAEAVLFGDESVTYGELEQRANRLAHHLASLGIAPREPVGICVERSIDLVVGVLGILKAGGAYVPLDPSYPPERLAYMQRNAALPAVIVHAATAGSLPAPDDAGGGPRVVDLDCDAEAIAAQPADRPSVAVEPSDLLYVLYTSGSTGRPKGVAMPHAPLVNLMHWQFEESTAGPGTRTLQFASLSFDVSCQELFATLGSGGTLCLVDEELRRDPERVLALLRERSIARIFVPFVALQQLVEVAVDREFFPDALREVVTAGEQLQVTPALVEFFRRLPDCTLVNQYGPTECHVVTALTLEGPPETWSALPPIGRPIANTTAYVLDERMEPVPIGVPGELYLGGAAPARGYLNDAEQTARKFVRDPFAKEPDARLYRTGDQARWLPGGDLEFLGRADDQVKVRGFRVELGEIEAVLADSEGVSQAVVVVREDRPGDLRLVAYLTAAEGASMASDELREQLRSQLPDYMVPAAFVQLDELPLTPSGKVNRRSLLAAEHAPLELQRPHVASRGPVEEVLVEVWSDVLGVADPGVHDDFFELGGHSLMATQVVSRVRDALRIELPLRALFEHPTIAGLAAEAERRRGGAASAAPIEPRPASGTLPLSFQQQRLWVLDQMGFGRVYVMPWAFRLEGELDADVLERSLSAVVARHEALRTRFPSVDGQPTQEILPAGRIPLESVDLRELAPEAREAEIERRLAAEETRSFDLATGPLLCPSLVRLAEREHLLLLTVHHIAFDGWSVGVLNRELAAHYAAFTAGEKPALPELPVQYADYSAWQAARMRDDELRGQLEYWRAKLTDLPELELPTDRPRPKVQAHRGSIHRFDLPPALTRALRVLSRRQGVTLAMTLMAGFKALLSRYCGQTDVVVGTPVANRRRSEVEGLIGFFVNTLVLRTDLSGDPSFRELLVRVQDTTLAAYEHQELPFERLVDELQPERDLGRNPLFQAMIVVQNAPMRPMELHSLKIQPLAKETNVTRFDLELHLVEQEDGIAANLCYSTDLFDGDTVARMAEHLEALLESAAADPDLTLSALPLLGEVNRHRIVREWNDTGQDFALDRCLHEHVEDQVSRSPDAVAVEFEGEELTYGRLNERANRVARHLRSVGVDRGSRVAVCVDRSTDFIVALLGVLKCDAAYVPLDSDSPPQRQRAMLADVEPAAIVTRAGLEAALPEGGAPTVDLDRDRDAIAARDGSDLPHAATGDDLAYVMYTSGSTGRPKGVCVPHAAIENLVLGADYLQLGPADRVAQASNASFDAATFEIWGALLNGARLVGVEKELALAPRRFAAAIRERELTVLFVTTALFNRLVDEVPDIFAPLRCLLFGGEAVNPDRVRALLAGDPPERLLHVYGPTENTTFSTWYEVREVPAGATTVPIGGPIAGTTCHVLDGDARPVPVGSEGELCVGGGGLATGYFGDPQLTAAKFVSDPFDARPGARLYRTGDVVRRVGESCVEFVGRVDHQVKLRGFRIELGEIESVLAQAPGVREAAAIVRDYGQGDRRLLAYVVPVAGADPGRVVESARAHAGKQIPEYMVPASLVILDALPLTPSGKVDRRALERRKDAGERPAGDYTAPRSSVEEALAGIWAEVLKVERVGIHDNFFRLGGDSILGIQMVARANKAGLRLEPKQLFEHQSVAELAGIVEVGAGRRAAAADQGPVTGEVPLTPVQHWFLEQELAEQQHFNQAVLLTVRRPLEARVLEAAVRELLEHHDALRHRFRRSRGQWRQVAVAPDAELPLERIDLSPLPPGERTAALEERVAELQASLDLRAGPLLRVASFHLGAGELDRLLVAIHHLAVDVVSWNVLVDDLETLCAQFSAGEPARLPAKTTSFQEWSRRLQDHAQSDEASRELDYWLGHPWSEVRELPVDHAGGGNPVAAVRRVTVSLDEDQMRRLLQDAPAAYRTSTEEVLLAALAQALAGWTGGAPLLVNLEGHGREDIFDGVDLSRTVGWFTTMTPLVLGPFPALADPGEVLKAVKEAVRGTPRRGLGYGLLRYLHLDEAVYDSLEKLPAPQVSFNHVGRLDRGGDEAALFGPAEESPGPLQGARNERTHILDVMSGIRRGQLQVVLEYGGELHERASVEALAEDFAIALRSLIAHCTAQDAGGLTPSEFPHARIDQQALDKLVERYGRDDVEDIYALSPMQLGMMYHSLDAPAGGVYVQQMHYVVDGLDPDALRRAWERVLERHAVLRTSIVGAEWGEPVQLVHQRAALDFVQEDLRDRPEPERALRVEAFLAEDAGRGFDLADPSLMRVALLRVAEDRQHLVWTFHHAVLDGWSYPIVLSEVLRYHVAFRAGAELDLPEPRPYRDHIAWLERQDLRRAEAYWRRTLAGFGEPTAPRIEDRVAEGAGTESYGEHRFQLSEEATVRLREAAREQRVTLNTLVLGAWSIVLSRYAGVEDVVMGTTASGRPADLDGVDSMVGLFINTLPMRVEVPTDRVAGDWLRELQANQLEQRDFEYSPLSQVQRWSEVPGGTPLFETLFLFENFPADGSAGDAGGVRVRYVPSIQRTGYPLSLAIGPQRELAARLTYDARRYRRADVEGLARHLQRVLEELVARPAARVGELEMLSEAERRRLTVDWNTAPTEDAPPPPIHELVRAHAERTPDAPAVAFEGRVLSYGELQQAADQLARRLLSFGIGREDRVGILLERSPEAITAVLATLEAGAAYVPLDASYPPERLAYMLADSGAAVLLTERELVEGLPRFEGAVVCLDEECDPTSVDDRSLPAVSPEQLAYVIYTSGSTGMPKGVQIEHAQLSEYVRAVGTALRLPDGASFATVSTLAADLGNTAIFPALCGGGVLHLVSEDRIGDGDAFAEYMHREAVDCVKVVPSHLEGLLNAARRPERVLPRKLLVLGGEASSWELIERVRQLVPECAVLNHYGPTETTVGVFTHRVAPEDRGRFPMGPPIGRPLPGTRAYVLDRHGRPVPVGVPGELNVGGVQVTRGYLNQPELTAERYVRDPFQAAADARMYRTGDLVRHTAEGALEFLGRADDQVKIRGFRVELGEIEEQLSRLSAVQTCALLACEGRGAAKGKRLVAYVVPREGTAPDAAALRSELATLPDYMVPASFVFLDAMPLTPNGKIDRDALPEPDLSTEESRRSEYAPPRTPAEEALAGIWSRVLRVERVGVHDDFFELGGDSILSIQIISRANEAGLSLKPKDLFLHPTVAELASLARSAPAAVAEQGPVTGVVPLTPIQRRYFEHESVDLHYFNHAMLLEAREPLDAGAVERALGHVVDHHDVLRARYAREGAGWRQEIGVPGARVPFERIDLSGAPDEELGTAIESAAEGIQASLDLTDGPLVRAALLTAGRGRSERLLVVIHHLLVDIVSWGILLDDLETAYRRLVAGEPVALPPKTTSYKAWAERLEEEARSEALAEECTRWSEETRWPERPLPIDHPDDAERNTSASVETVSVSLSEDETRVLLREVPRAYRAGMEDALLTALARAAGPWTGARDVLVEVEGHGRDTELEGVDLSRTVGWFTAIQPVVLDGATDRDPGVALGSTKEALRRLPSGGAGWSVLCRLGSGAVADACRARPTAEIGFNYMGQVDKGLAVEDALFAPSRESIGPGMSLRKRRRYLLDVRGSVSGGRLTTRFLYSRFVHERATIEALARRFAEELRGLAEHCGATAAAAFTPSDFPLADLGPDELDRISARYGERIEDVYALTGLQKGMVYHTLAEPESAAYVSQLAFTLEGELDTAALEQAWCDVLAAHPVLRTACVIEGLEDMHQVVLRDVPLPWRTEDWRELDEDVQRARLEELGEEDRRLGFDLGEAPLMRLHLIRTGERKSRLVWTHHHALLDGWALAVLIGDLFRAYYARRDGRPPELRPGRPFADYIRWLREQDRGEAEAYWRERLASHGEPTPLPARATPLAPDAGPARATRQVSLSANRSAELHELARNHRLTPNTVVLGAWALLLARYSAREDVVFGVTVSGRPADFPGVERMLGLFINTLPMRVEVADEDLVPWLQTLQEEQLQLQQFAHTPLYEIQGWSGSGAGKALFESIFVFENYPAPETHAAGGESESDLSVVAPEDVSFSNYPLAVVVRGGDRIHLECRYDRARFDDDTIERLLAHLRALLEGMIAEPERRTSALPLIDAEERRRVVVDWNDTRTDYPRERGIHELFEEQVAQRPDATALVFGEQELSYAELDRRANQVANHLVRLGVGPETMVAISAERSLETIVGIVGILKAGGAYVPLQPDYPKKRVEHMLADTRAPVLLTLEHLQPALPEFAGHIVRLDADRQEIAREPETPPETRTGAESLAYVIYTSGSTGTPKGNCIEHRSVVRLVKETNYLELGPDEVFLQFAPIAFDASTLELWGSLLNGAQLVVPPPGPLSLEELGRILVENRVSTLWLTGALFRQMVDTQLEALRGVRQLLAGGEALSVPHVRRVIETLGEDARLVNGYGPTENTTFTCCHVMTTSSGVGRSVPIGRPIANTRVYVLDRNLEPVPVGVPGELCAAGDGLARGYLNDEELTAEKFVRDPFSDEPGARMYRTGDLARWLPDGSLEFLGRTDEQVKVRGFRIEPGEIEAALAELPGVRDAVVVCKEDAAGDGRLVAYVVGEGDEAPTSGRFQEALGERLPDHMVPGAFVFLDEIPVTANGKVDRRALPEPAFERGAGERRYVPPRSELEDRIAAIWSEVLGVERVGARDNFFDLGGHSLKLLRVHARLKEELGCELRVTELFEYPTVEALARRLGDEGATEAELRVAAEARIGRRGDAGGNSIAIVGMAGRFPGASDVETLWSNLRAGVESIRTFSDEELRKTGVPEPLLQDPNYVKARAVLDDVDLFDAWFFGYSPREAELIDPQQRIFLECASEALERAGCDPERFEGLIGVYAGVSANTYIENLRSRPDLMAALGGMQAIMSSDRDYVATRVSYKLDLRGPSMNLQTACSTSLVAVHEACRSLLDRQCDVALAGGVSITIPLERGYLYSQEGIRSSDGHNRTFDARAEGTVSGQGSAAVVLKRLEDALAGGDEIHAVILGTALSNDGSDKVGFTAPSVEGQARTIAMAQAAAGVDPATISYVEAHGTATALGDPIEVAALTRVFRERTQARGFCALGSIKSNMGHLNDAAGVAGLIKTTLALRHRELPPSLHFEEPNPEIDFEASPFYVVAEREEWRAPDGLPRRAGVSSFGLGGTNAHAVLEEAPVRAPSAPGREWQVLPLSAKGPRALDAMAANLAGHLRRNPEENLADVAWTLQTGRRELEYRRAVWCRSAEDAVAVLEGGAPERVGSRRAPAKERPVVFLFPGHGHQHVDMGRGLYHAEPVFRDAVDEGLAVLESELDFDLRAAMFPDGDREAAAKRLLHRPLVFQPAIFLVDYAMDRLWRSWGVEPSACIGHSLGEFVAATSAGVLRMEDALRLVVLRGRLMEETPPGAMLALTLTADEVRERIADEPGVWLSTINAPELCLVAGAPESIEAFERRLTASGVECNRMHAAHAYHSGLMESGVEPLSEAVRGLTVEPPQVPYVSNVSGDWITEDEIREPAYWGRHMAATVRFAEGMERILEDPDRVLLEVGPGQIVSSLARLHESCGPDRVVVPSMRHPQGEEDDVEFLMGAVGRLWTGGVRPDWERFQASERRRVTLPTYPFERKRYWIERRDTPGAGPGWAPARKADVGDWFHVSAWRRAAAPTLYDDVLPEPCLVFTDGSPFCARLVDRLGESGHPIVTVEAGEAFRRSDTGFAIDPGSPEDYGRLVRELEDAAGLPGRVLHLWNAGPVDGTPEDPERVQERSFFSLFHLARAIGEAEVARPLWIQVVTEGVHDVTGDEVIQPEKATVLGPCRVLAFEFPNVTCRNVDLAADDVRAAAPEWLERVAHELLSDANERVVTLRNGKRWVETFAPVRLDRPGGELPRRLRPGGAYLVTGGLTGIGSVLAQYLAQVPGAKLVLTGRTPLPERAEWERILEEHPAEDAVARRIRVVRTLEEAGAEVLAVEADVADLERMRAVVAEATRRFGAIRGVVHAAGVQAGGPIVLQEPGRAAQSLRPKVGGARVLRRLFEDGGLDFLVLCSSLNSVKGFPGVVDYSAANAYLDAFARRYAADTGTYAVSLGWNRWREVGMAAEAHGGALAEGRGISNAEGVEVLRRVLDGCDEPRLLVSEFDFWTMLSSVDRATEAEEGLDGASADEESSAQAAHSRPDLATAYVAPRTELERELVQVWEYLFGIDGIGVEDSFFDLGGHSLLATRLLNKLNRTHPGANLTLRGIFKSPSVALLAEKIEAAGDGRGLGEVTIPAPEEPILATTDDLPDLDALSDEEVTALVAQMMEESELDERR